jgi:uncharacterized protein
MAFHVTSVKTRARTHKKRRWSLTGGLANAPARPEKNVRGRNHSKASVTVLRLVIVYGCAIVAAESITNLVNPVAGAVLHLVTFAALIVHGALEQRSRSSALWLSLSLVPLIRVISLGLPLGAFSQEWWYLLSAIPLLAAAITAMHVMGYTRQHIGFRLPLSGTWTLTIAVAFSGFFIGLGEYALLGPTSTFDSWGTSNLLIGVLILLIGTGLVEEFVFRGLLQTSAVRTMNVVPGIVLVGVMFALMHMGHGSLLNVIYIFFVSLYLSVARLRTGSLLASIAAHTLANVVLFIFMTN